MGRAAGRRRFHKRIDFSEAAARWRWPPPPLKSNYEILLGDGCNAACLFCCAYKEIGNWLPWARVKGDIAREQAAGTQMITFSGGEPTLYPGLARAVAFARKSGFTLIQAISNGMKFADAAFAREIAGAGLNLAKVSLHGVDAATHDRLTGVKGSFELALEGMSNLNALGVYTSLNMAVTKANYRQLPLYVKFFSERMALTGFCFYFGFYTGRMADEEALQVPYSEVTPYMRYALEYMRQRKVRIDWKVLGNFVPCLMPEYANVMMDWGRTGDAPGRAVVRKKGESLSSGEFMSKRKVLPATCRGCAYYGACYGIDRRYYEKFGSGEFRPVKTPPASFPLEPIY